MEKISIRFNGITRDTDDGVCNDGDMMELINARIRNGCVEPVGKPIQVAGLSRAYTKIYWHPSAKRYIGITSEGRLYEMDGSFSSESPMAGDCLSVYSVGIIGYTVAVMTAQGIRYFIFRGGSYVYLGELPELPYIRMTKTLVVESVASEEELIRGRGRTQEEAKAFDEAQYGYWLKAVSKLNKKGCFVRCAEFRMAFRLFDGSYVKHSPVRLLCVYDDDSESYTPKFNDRSQVVSRSISGSKDMVVVGAKESSADYNGRVSEYCCFSVLGFRPSFAPSSFDLSEWGDIISSIDIFCSKSFIEWDRTCLPEGEDPDDPIEEIAKNSLFYRLASISLSGYVKTDTEDVSADALAASQDTLPDDGGTNNRLVFRNSYSYNNRLHAYGYSESLFEGYGNDWTLDSEKWASSVGDISVKVFIRTSSGIRTVTSVRKSVSLPGRFTPLVMYPDYRAYKCVVSITYLGGGSKFKIYQLSPHRSMNISYYLYHFGTGSPKADDVSEWENGTVMYTDYGNAPEPHDDVLKVSAADNPFYFPPDQTYRFGSPIIGVQSNVVAMSQGQFGHHPLYVFTGEGVFAMQVGTGSVAYSSQTPVTRDVCTNPGSICGTDTSVVFSTSKGLMSISGAVSSVISGPMDGFLPSCVQSSPVIMKIMSIPGMGGAVSSVVFTDYIKAASVAYNYRAQEIVVSNPSFQYSYVYGIESGQWHKIFDKADSFANVYPDMYAICGNRILDLNNFHRSVADICLVTRPLKMGTSVHKRVLQAALRGIVKRSLSDLYLRGEPVMFRGDSVSIFSDVGMYILGSNDAEHFSLVAKKEMMVDIRDLVTKMNKTRSYKYFMVCLVGGVRTDVSLNCIEMTVDTAWSNRLR